MRLATILCAVGTLLGAGCQTDPATLPANYVLLDVRTPGEYETGHLKGAVLMPYDTIRSSINTVVTNKSEQIVLYCRSGRRASIARDALASLGYTQVINLGGVSAAAKATQLPVVR